MYDTFIPKVCVVTRWGRSGGVVTVARDEMGDVSRGVMLKEEGDGHCVGAVRNWGVVACAGTDER